MDLRVDFFEKMISDQSKRILEIGPLNRPIADKKIYPNTYYCDIRSTEDVQRLYSGNDYLEATGIMINPETIVPIDYVIQESYEKTFEKIEKFDFVIASHVLEHTENLIFSLQDISTILSTGGMFCIVYPDKRYCFDHFRTSASFRDAYRVFRNGSTENAQMVFDFYFSVISENNPCVFWEKDSVLDYLPESSYKHAVKHYEEVLSGSKMEDIHYWPFSDMDFLKFLYDCTRAGLIPLRCVSFQPCAQYDQQFMVALQKDPDVLINPDQALNNLRLCMKNVIPDYYSAKDVRLLEENKRLWNLVEKQKEVIDSYQKAVNVLLHQDCSIGISVKDEKRNKGIFDEK